MGTSASFFKKTKNTYLKIDLFCLELSTKLQVISKFISSKKTYVI